jgi:hypothetical protein
MKKNREARDIHGPQVIDVIRKHFGADDQERRILAEVGVFKGELTEYLLEQLPNWTVIMVDCWDAIPVDPNYIASGDSCATMPREEMRAAKDLALNRTGRWADRRRIYQGGTLEMADAIRRDFGPASLDAAFIDADHTYKAVLGDIYAYSAVIRPNTGLMFGHDYGAPRDVRGIWGVKRAVDEYGNFLHKKICVGNHKVWWYE